MAQTKGTSDDGTIVLGTRVSPEFVKKVMALAAKETRTLSNMVHVLLKEAMTARGIKP